MKRFSIGALTILISVFISISATQARGKKKTNVFHKVKHGEYLGSIAKKYRTNVTLLTKWNNISIDGVLPAGKIIKVGHKKTKQRKKAKSWKSAKKAVYYKVRRGDTLSGLAKKYKTKVKTLQKWNRLSANSHLIAGKRIVVAYKKKSRAKKKIPEGTRWLSANKYTKVKLPLNYQLPRVSKKFFKTPYYQFRIYSVGFNQGKAAYLEFIPKRLKKGFKLSLSSLQITFLGKNIPLTKTSFGYRAIFALPPEQRPGRYAFVLSFNLKNKFKRYNHLIQIADIKYPVTIWRRNIGQPGKRRPMNQKRADFIRSSTRIKKIAFKHRSTDKFTNKLSHPRSLHKITSQFFTTRKIVRYYYKNRKRIYKKSLYRKHRGTDLRGLTGAPLYAMASGRVVLADRLYFEGKFTMIDHGNGIFTGYMHQSKMHVYNGEKIAAGQLIGKSGGTGVVTGPHLHMSLWIRGVAVEPLSLLSLPIRN